MGPAESSPILNFWGPGLAAPCTLRPMQPPAWMLPASCCTPSVSSTTHRWPFGCCEPLRGTPGWCTPCGAARLLAMSPLWTALTTWYRNASAPSLACIWRPLLGPRPPVVGSAKLAWAFAPPKPTLQARTLPPWVPQQPCVGSLIPAIGWIGLGVSRLLCPPSMTS